MKNNSLDEKQSKSNNNTKSNLPSTKSISRQSLMTMAKKWSIQFSNKHQANDQFEKWLYK